MTRPFIRCEYGYGCLQTEYIPGDGEARQLLAKTQGSSPAHRAPADEVAQAVGRAVGLVWIWHEPYLLRSHMDWAIVTGAEPTFRRIAVVLPSIWTRGTFLMKRHVRRLYRGDEVRVFVRDEEGATAWVVRDA